MCSSLSSKGETPGLPRSMSENMINNFGRSTVEMKLSGPDDEANCRCFEMCAASKNNAPSGRDG